MFTLGGCGAYSRKSEIFCRVLIDWKLTVVVVVVVRLENSPYFWVFKYARAVKQKVWNEAENNERDWGPANFTSRLHSGQTSEICKS